MGHLPEVAVTVLRRPGMAVVSLLFILVGAAFLTQVVPYRQILESRRQVAVAQQRLDRLVAENQRLQSDVDALNSNEEIEKMAREKLGYVRPGEIPYVVLDPPAGEQTQPAAPPEPAAPEKTWVDRIWAFITGADAASN